MCAGATKLPRREATRTGVPSTIPRRLGILGAQIQGFRALQRRDVAGGLHPSVVRIEATPGGEDERILGVGPLDGGLVLHDREWGGLPNAGRARGVVPQSPVQELRAGM